MVPRLDLIDRTLSVGAQIREPSRPGTEYSWNMSRITRVSKWLAVTTAGGLLVVAGVVLLFLPGPGLLLIVAGLALLSLEYSWAARLRGRASERLQQAREARRSRRWDEAPRELSPHQGARPDTSDPGQRGIGAA